MGQAHSSGAFFHQVNVKDHFASLQGLWNEEDFEKLLVRLKTMTLNFSLDRQKFGKLLQLSTSFDELVAKWFQDFSNDRASQVTDGLEFMSGVMLISSKVTICRKIALLFNLFDLDKTDCIRKDEFTIFLKATTTGLHRMLTDVPPPATVSELGRLSAEYFSTLNSNVLSENEFLSWILEAHYSLHYLSVLSKLGATLFAWGTNHRLQVGFSRSPREQLLPAPILALENVQITTVASNESHSLFLTTDGRVFSCGSGFCGILGHGNLENCPQPQPIEALEHTKIVDVAVGVRHSMAVSEKGQVFTWGAADMGQCGHGSTDDRDVHDLAYDQRTGSTFTYITKPTVVMDLFGQKIIARRAACCNFSSMVVTDGGHVYSWGNNTDGQCGHGQKCDHHKLMYLEPHMHRTAMQIVLHPQRVAVDATFKSVTCGGYHALAIDEHDRLWTWGQGLWGKLGHGDQRSMYEPKIVRDLQFQACQETAAGENHSLCLCSLVKVTITGGSTQVAVSPFSLLALPLGRIDKHRAGSRLMSPKFSSLQLNAFASARLMQLGLPFRLEDAPIVNRDKFPLDAVQQSVVLMDHGLWEGEWLKLATTDYDFKVNMSTSGAPLRGRLGITSHIMFPLDGKFEVDGDCVNKICVFELSSRTDKITPAELTPVILELVLGCQEGQGLACICILPKRVDSFDVVATPESVARVVSSFPFGVMSNEHGSALKKHISCLVKMRMAEAADGAPDDVKEWQVRRDNFTGMSFFEHERTLQRRRVPPLVNPCTEASLMLIKEDTFLQRLAAVVEMKPKGIVICQQSWRPDVELVELPETVFDLLCLDVPLVMVTYEAAEEIKAVLAKGGEPWLSMEMHTSGGVYAWGHGTSGQLGLAGIENQSFLIRSENALIQEENLFANRPSYVAHLHEHQVTSIACGAQHTVAVTQQGEVFTWGGAAGLGVSQTQAMSEVPIFVEQLEALVKATKAFAGHQHSFTIAEMPYKSVVG
eukprot:CAMPEP_0194477338 /NCGR_PEP_ID=MMETSP0253-20130528/1102_1 /TAXON_ID=2966 /ORGANISM="Noctiluca scintillans" /LENGTH=985 /DNA_ID=CAMNT_0039316301 /DNA_START=74 /DNA_END=3031 /DNA_ORIENTATION=+